MKSSNWFEVDRKGLADLVERRGKSSLLFELISNAWDEPRVTKVEVRLESITGSRDAALTVEDDAPQGFALPLDTPIPTPSGWTTIGDIRIGDMLYDGDGRITYVLNKTPTLEARPCYSIVLADKGEIIADALHLWNARTANDRQKGLPSRLRTTEDLFQLQSRRDQHFDLGHQPVLDCPKLSLPLDPYLLGYWLGDGTRCTSRITCTPKDAESLGARVRAAGFPFVHDGNRTSCIKGLISILQVLGVSEEKHVPPLYLRAHAEDRLALLQGMCDSDGTPTPHNRRNMFYNSNLQLIAGFEELVLSLGGKFSHRIRSRAGWQKTRMNGGRPIHQNRDGWAISFVVPWAPFQLQRKIETASIASAFQRRRNIHSIVPVAPRDVACITISSPSGIFLAGRSMIPTHNCDISDAHTLFAPSRKKENAEQRGRFNLGEKLVLALCSEAEIISTQSAVRFDDSGRHRLAKRREKGTQVSARLRMTREEVRAALASARLLIPPEGIATTVNGEPIARRTPLRQFNAILQTELQGEDGLRRTERLTEVAAYAPRAGEAPMVFELGIPVVEHSGLWHLDVSQKVPLNLERDNVPPAFLRRLRAAALDAGADLVGREASADPWIRDALPLASVETVRKVIERRFGKAAVTFDPSDLEANKCALDKGYQIVRGGALSGEEWKAVKAAGALKPAGQIFPSGVPSSPDGKPPVPHSEWTPAMHRLSEYVHALGQELLGFGPEVQFQRLHNGKSAWWGFMCVTFNITVLGRAWIEKPSQDKVDGLLLHEFSHHFVSDHYTREFSDSCCRLGARLRLSKAVLATEAA